MKYIGRSSFDPSFSRNVLKLFSSSAIAAGIAGISLPVITRIFSQADYGLFTALYSVTILFGMVTSLKYEQAIVLPESEADGRRLTALSILLVGVTTGLLGIPLFLLDEGSLALLKLERLAPYWPYVLASVAGTGLLEVSRYALIRKKQFWNLAANKIVQPFVQYGFSIAVGFSRPEFVVLFIGYFAGVAIPTLMVAMRGLLKPLLKPPRALLDLGRTYVKFPLNNTPSTFLNTLSLQLPVFMFLKYFDAEMLGLYALANQAAVIPLNLIGTSVQQVYYQASAEAFRRSPRDLERVYLSTIKKLTVVGVPMITAMVLLAPTLVRIVFGSEWAQSGVFVQILSLGLLFRFLNSPVASTLFVLNRQEVGLGLIGVSLVIRFAAMYLFQSSPTAMLWALSVSTALFYGIYNLSIFWFIRRLTREGRA